MSKKTLTIAILVVVAVIAVGAAYMRLVLNRQAVDNTRVSPLEQMHVKPVELSPEQLKSAAESLRATTTPTKRELTEQEKAAERLKAPFPTGGQKQTDQDTLIKAAEALKAK